MICRFCSQWNPDGARRCVFCGNHAEASQDDTRSGRISLMSQEQMAKVPTSRDLGVKPQGEFEEWIQVQWQRPGVKALAVGLVLLVLYLLGR